MVKSIKVRRPKEPNAQGQQGATKGATKPGKGLKVTTLPIKRPDPHVAPPEEPPITLDDLTFLSASAKRALAELSTPDSHRSAEVLSALTDDALSLLKRDLEGQLVEHLELTLDWLREVGAYSLSLELLEEAWSAELPLEMMGRVAQDWLGTALFGMNDEEGAREVARHLTPRALELGASFCGDLCDVMLEWGLHEEASPLARFVAESQPGDLSAKFHLGVCAKLSQDWALARESFEAVARQHPTDPATLWNLGVVAVAERRWGEARSRWRSLGFTLPEGEGDYATPGELSPVRLSCRVIASDRAPVQSLSERAQTKGSLAPKVKTEVLWGLRLCPARVQLTGVPYHHPTLRCGDVVLIDGVRAGEAEYQGQRHPISPVIGLWEASKGETIDLLGPPMSAAQRAQLDELIEALAKEGRTLAHWSERFPRRLTLEQGGATDGLLTQLTVYLSGDTEEARRDEARALCEKLSEAGLYQAVTASEGAAGELYHERWAALLGEPVELHVERRAQLLG